MEKKYFSIGDTAKMVKMTAETLRHYDRIGLVRPGKVDAQTKYRYYSAEDIVRLNTVHALQQMDLPLQEIKQVLEYDDLQKIIQFLKLAEERADEKIASLQYSKSKIRLARADYEKKLNGAPAPEGVFIRRLPERVIMLADAVAEITMDDLWNYHRHFYKQLDESQKDKFTFEDLAGVYHENGEARYFAVCGSYENMEGLKRLPAGAYLCADCTEGDKDAVLEKLTVTAQKQYGVSPRFFLQLVVISGILQWKYQLQILLEVPE